MSVAEARFLAAAYDDVESAYVWYESQHAGLGAGFVHAVEAAITAAIAFPEAHPVVHRDARRILIPRFPFCLFYRLDSCGVILIACLHAARDPELAHTRIDDGIDGEPVHNLPQP